MFSDLRFAFRMIRTHRWFSAAVIVTLALGIGVNTTVFTLVNPVLFKPVPLPRGDRLVTVSNHHQTDLRQRDGIAYRDFVEYQANNGTFADLEAGWMDEVTISETGNPPERLRMMRASAGMFTMLRTAPVLGRGFRPDEAKPGAEPVVLISHGIWQSRYGGAADVIDRPVRINGTPATIVGVMPEGFKFPNSEELWMPLVPTEALEDRAHRWLQLFGILKEGTSIDQANRDLAVIGARLAAEFPDTNKEWLPEARTFHQTYNGDQIEVVFLAMLGAVGFVLLIACANVANMMLGRAIARRREISVRVAMGASRFQLVRQLLVESVVLSLLGGSLGLGLTAFGVHAFDVATTDVGKPYWIIFAMDWRAFGYFAAISVLSGIMFGLVPALKASRVDLNTALKDDTRGAGSARGNRLTAALVVLQFALTVVLLACAGMMMRSFFAAQAINPFVPAEQIFTARVQLPEGKGERYEDPVKRKQFHEQLAPRLARLPGVVSVAAASSLPGMGAGTRPVEIEDHPLADVKQASQAGLVVQTPSYLATVGVPILLGRGFNETDGTPGKEAAIVTRGFAATHWPGEPAVGKRFRFRHNPEPGPWMTVIGVCPDVVQQINEADAAPPVFIPYEQEAWGWMALAIRTTGDAAALAAPVRAAVQELDLDLPLFEVATLTGRYERQRWFLEVFGTLFLSFALIGLLLASVGIYGVIAHATGRRTREIGIRMALGATGGSIQRMVLRRGVWQLGIGMVLGLAGAFAAVRVLTTGGILGNVSPDDPLVFSVVTAVLLAVGLFACWLPARRAARIEPTEALRSE